MPHFFNEALSVRRNCCQQRERGGGAHLCRALFYAHKIVGQHAEAREAQSQSGYIIILRAGDEVRGCHDEDGGRAFGEQAHQRGQTGQRRSISSAEPDGNVLIERNGCGFRSQLPICFSNQATSCQAPHFQPVL